MTENIRKLNHILSRSQKHRVVALCIMILVSGLLETVGIGAVLPLVQAILNREGMIANEKVQLA